MNKLIRRNIPLKTLLAGQNSNELRLQLIEAEMGMSTSHCNDPVMTELIDDTHTEAPQVGYNAVEEGEMTTFFNLVGEAIVGIN